MTIFVEVAVNIPRISGVFHYHLPPELEGCVEPGHLVEVPFGQQTVQGIVLRLVSEPEVQQTKAVLGLVDSSPVLTPVQLALAAWMSDYSLAPLAACMGLMLPPGLAQQADVLYALVENQPGAISSRLAELNEVQLKLLGLLQRRGPLRGRQVDHWISFANWRSSVRLLVKRGLVTARPVLPPPTVKPKSVRTVQLACPPEEAQAQMESLGRANTAALARRQAMLRFLLRTPDAVEVPWIYAESGGSLDDLYALAERGLIVLGESETWRDPLAEVQFVASEPPELTEGQQAAWESVRSGLLQASGGQMVLPFVLHGVTGSGKTEIYLRAVEETLRQGRQAVVLVPEIALTPQTVRRFMSRFPGRVGLSHSQLSDGERYDTWRRARLGQIAVMVGPRSALFTPFANLGLVVVDEFHDDSYFQAETPPNYHARQAAVACARIAGAVCLLGSATPDVATQYSAAQQGWNVLTLPKRIMAHRQAVQAQAERLGLASHYQPVGEQAQSIDLPAVSVVDMRRELKAGNPSIFSRELQERLSTVLERSQQAILFLNRRGSATYVFCRDCGYTLKCPRCDLPLIYHVMKGPIARPKGPEQDLPLASGVEKIVLVCHHCNYQRAMPRTCPQCGSQRIRQYGTGTEKVEVEVQALFPNARTLRWDYETTRHKGAHDIILSHFANHRADILIGTQMIAKGLDLPFVTLVGMVLADVGLSLPDYRANERTFQILTQVAGRAGRSPLGGRVMLQTFQPQHYVIQAAAGHDYAAFYRQELEQRRQLGYPPFTRLVRLEYRHNDPIQAERAAQEMAGSLRAWLAAEDRRATDLIGPAPCFFARLGGQYRWQIVLRGPQPATLLHDRILKDWRVEVDPVSLL